MQRFAAACVAHGNANYARKKDKGLVVGDPKASPSSPYGRSFQSRSSIDALTTESSVGSRSGVVGKHGCQAAAGSERGESSIRGNEKVKSLLSSHFGSTLNKA